MFYFIFSHDSIRRLESFTKDALSITKMIEERKRMMHYRSHSTDSMDRRSRASSHDPIDGDDDDIFDDSTPSVNRRRVRKKKKPQQKNNINHTPTATAIAADADEEDNQNFETLRRRLSR